MVTDKTAESRGYKFTGVYSSEDYEMVKRRAENYRKQGFKVLITTHSYTGKCGRGGLGKSVYIKETNQNFNDPLHMKEVLRKI